MSPHLSPAVQISANNMDSCSKSSSAAGKKLSQLASEAKRIEILPIEEPTCSLVNDVAQLETADLKRVDSRFKKLSLRSKSS